MLAPCSDGKERADPSPALSKVVHYHAVPETGEGSLPYRRRPGRAAEMSHDLVSYRHSIESSAVQENLVGELVGAVLERG